MSVLAQDTLTGAGVQTVTGAKTFKEQKLVFRNPADTFSLTMRNPAITANQDTRVNEQYAYYIFKEGSTFYAKSGITQGIEFSGSDAATVIQSAVTAILASSRGGIILFSPDDFPLAVPIDIPTSTTPKPLGLFGVYPVTRDYGTIFSATAAFPTNRYLFETSGATDGSNKWAMLYMKDVGGLNLLQFSSANIGFLKYDIDKPVVRSLQMENIYGQYLWRGIHLLGATWWNVFNNLHFEDFNTSFVGDTDILLEKGSHTSAINPWPKNNIFIDLFPFHTGNVNNYIRITEGGYNVFSRFMNEAGTSAKVLDACISLSGTSSTNPSHNNTFDNAMLLDLTTNPSPDNRTGAITLNGAWVYDNKFTNLRLLKNKHHIAIIGGAFRNHMEVAGYWGNALDVDNVGCGDYNTIKIFPGSWDGTTTPYGNAPTKPILSGSATENARIMIIDERNRTKVTGVSTQSGNASTTAFNIAHGLAMTPLTYSIEKQSADAIGEPVVTATSTNIVITYPVAPPTGTNNLTWVWSANIY